MIGRELQTIPSVIIAAQKTREQSSCVKVQSKMQWNEPRWSYRPRIKSELSTVLSAKMWLRVVVWVFVIAAGMAFAARRAVPDLEFNWMRAVAVSLSLFAVYFGAVTGLLWFVPPRIRINQKGISRQQGQSARWRRRDDIQSITVDVGDSVHPRLRVESPGKKAWDVGIAAEVNIQDVVNCLRENFPHALISVKK